MALLRLVAIALFALLLSSCSSNAESVSAPVPSGSTAKPTTTTTTTESVSATPPTSSSSPPSLPPPTPSAQRVVLTGDGAEIDGDAVPFGTAYGEAAGPLTAALGTPWLNTGETSPFSVYGTCPGTVLRALEYAGGAAVFLFGDVDGPGLRFYAWNLRTLGFPDQAPRVRALTGDAAVFELGIGTTVAQLQDGAAAGTLAVSPGDEIFGPGFRLADQSGGLYGSLTNTSPTGTVTFISAGSGCGE